MISTGPTKIEIKSEAVIHALRTVSGYYPGVSLTGDSVRLYEPFPFLYHHRKELQEYADQYSQESSAYEDCREDQRVAADIGLLLDVFEEICGQDVRDELERHTQPVPTCTYDMMWMLFKPGMEIYKDRHELRVYEGHVVHELEFTYIDKKAGNYTLLTWRMQGDDASIGASKPESRTKLSFAGECDIAQLPWVPCEFMRLEENQTTDEQRRKELVERGKKYCSLLDGQQFVSFDGYSSGRPRLAYRGRAIVDMRRYYSEFKTPLLAKEVETLSAIVPRCNCPHCSDVQTIWSKRRIHFAGYGGSIRGRGESMTDRMLFLCADFIPAYVLKHRKWSKSPYTRAWASLADLHLSLTRGGRLLMASIHGQSDRDASDTISDTQTPPESMFEVHEQEHLECRFHRRQRRRQHRPTPWEAWRGKDIHGWYVSSRCRAQVLVG